METVQLKLNATLPHCMSQCDTATLYVSMRHCHTVCL